MTCKQCGLEMEKRKRTRWAEGMYAENSINQMGMPLSQAEIAGKRAYKEVAAAFRAIKGHRPVGQLAREDRERREQMAIGNEIDAYVRQIADLKNRIYDLGKRQKHVIRSVERD